MPASTAGHRVSQPPRIHSIGALPDNIPGPISHGPFGGQLDAYRLRASQVDDSTRAPTGFSQNGLGEGNVSFGMWWQDAISTPLGLARETLPIDIAGITQTTLRSSPLVKAILTEPSIRRSDLVIADAEFDSLAFVEAKYADTNEPIGSDLTTGNNDRRFLDQNVTAAAGLRKKSRYGGSLEVAQRGGYQDNNSSFLVPNPQSTSRLEINFTQPLMKDHGRAVNNTRVLLAQIDVQLANSEVRGELEDHLIDVTNAYWELFQARAEWLQRNRLLEGATKLHDILQARGEVDSLQRQILRAQVAVTSRRSDLIRAETRIRNVQARLRALTGDPNMIQASRWELTPQDRPLAFPVQLSTREATLTALDNRPDIAQGIRKIQAVSARVGAAKNQVLPRLDLILSTYVSGLQDQSNAVSGFVDQHQFSDGRPSYAAGLLFEIPIGNRASQARLARGRWELSRAIYEFQQTTEVAFADVEIAVRETHTAFDEMATKQLAIDAASREVAYLQQRWELLPDPNESAVLLIEDLLDAQERLADEEREFVRAQVDYAISWVQLRKSMGVLLRLENLSHSPLIATKPTQGQANDHQAIDHQAIQQGTTGTSLR
jgi:outer membrane protein TolC